MEKNKIKIGLDEFEISNLISLVLTINNINKNPCRLKTDRGNI